jgi:hypothetical protein
MPPSSSTHRVSAGQLASLSHSSVQNPPGQSAVGTSHFESQSAFVSQRAPIERETFEDWHAAIARSNQTRTRRTYRAQIANASDGAAA